MFILKKISDSEIFKTLKIQVTPPPPLYLVFYNFFLKIERDKAQKNVFKKK